MSFVFLLIHYYYQKKKIHSIHINGFYETKKNHRKQSNEIKSFPLFCYYTTPSFQLQYLKIIEKDKVYSASKREEKEKKVSFFSAPYVSKNRDRQIQFSFNYLHWLLPCVVNVDERKKKFSFTIQCKNYHH